MISIITGIIMIGWCIALIFAVIFSCSPVGYFLGQEYRGRSLHQREQLVLWNHCGEHCNRYYGSGFTYPLAYTSANETVQKAGNRWHIHPWKLVGSPAVQFTVNG